MQLKQIAFFDLSRQEEAVRLTGWGPPEAGRRWALGRRSALSVARPEAQGDLLLLLDLSPRLCPLALTQQTLGVRVNDVPLLTAFLRFDTLLACRIPAELAAARPALEVEFEHQDVVHPDLLSASHDARGYTVGIGGLTLFEARATVEAGPAVSSLMPPPAEGLSVQELMAQFASLGDNCEFGLTQRSAGAEVMDLLRFAGVSLPGLARGVADGFAALANPGEIELQLHPFAPRGEYVVAARRYGYQSHSGVFEGDMDLQRLFVRETKKLRLLQRLFAADLATGGRILVFKHNDLDESADLSPLLRAIRAHGPATLLHVVQGGDPARHGQVEWAGPGLLRGHIDRFNPYSNAAVPSSPCWETICRQAYALWSAQPRREQAA